MCLQPSPLVVHEAKVHHNADYYSRPKARERERDGVMGWARGVDRVWRKGAARGGALVQLDCTCSLL